MSTYNIDLPAGLPFIEGAEPESFGLNAYYRAQSWEEFDYLAETRSGEQDFALRDDESYGMHRHVFWRDGEISIFVWAPREEGI